MQVVFSFFFYFFLFFLFFSKGNHSKLIRLYFISSFINIVSLELSNSTCYLYDFLIEDKTSKSPKLASASISVSSFYTSYTSVTNIGILIAKLQRNDENTFVPLSFRTTVTFCYDPYSLFFFFFSVHVFMCTCFSHSKLESSLFCVCERGFFLCVYFYFPKHKFRYASIARDIKQHPFLLFSSLILPLIYLALIYERFFIVWVSIFTRGSLRICVCLIFIVSYSRETLLSK